MKIISLVMLGMFCITLVPGSLLAESFNIRGHEVDVKWEPKVNADKKDIFVVNGTSTKGQPCKKLEVQFAFSSDHYKDQIPVAKMIIENYDPAKANDFSGEVIVETSKEDLFTWGFIDNAIKCLD